MCVGEGRCGSKCVEGELYYDAFMITNLIVRERGM